MNTKRRITLTATASAIALALALGGPTAGIGSAMAGEAAVAANISRAATDLPAPLPERAPRTVEIDLETVELMGQLDDGTTYRYWTFNGQVPGPMPRVRVGDTVKVNLTNDPDSWMIHNVDFHAVTGPHGGGSATSAEPGQTGSFAFKALKPGLYVYHCATPMVAQHIANGMYGMILVEPEEGLPPVDREFYVMQGEIYTEEAFGTSGELTESYDKLMNERPEYFVFNGSVQGLKAEPLKAKVGETVRIFFGVGGPNHTSSFHVIGEIFDKVYDLGSLAGRVTTDVQTVSVPPGGATVAELEFEVPGPYVIVDHALTRVDRGLAAMIEVEGDPDLEVFAEGPGV